jgi:hypothetical protein
MKTIAVALLSLSLVTSAAAQSAEPPQVIVTGEGVVKATPDQAWVSIGAEIRSKVSKDAQQRNAEVMTAVIQKIGSFGIPKDAIKTTAIDLQLEFDYANGKQTPRGYVARNTVEVRVDELSKLGDVLDAAVASGASNIHGVRFDVKQRDQLEASRRCDQVTSRPQDLKTSRPQDLLCQALPEVPGGDRTIRPPRLAHPTQFLRVRTRAQLVGALYCVHQSEVVGGKDVRPPQSKHQENLCGPAADAFDRDQLLHHVVVRVFFQALQIETPVEDMARQVLDERHFRAAEAARAYLVVGQRHHTLWGRFTVRKEIGEAAVDRRGGLG